MNYKLLFPTYRTRQRWVLGALDEIARERPIGDMLNVGCGEGDLDRSFKARTARLVSCDLNDADVAYARQLNAELEGATFEVQDATALTYADATFDVVTCVDVIEHVSDPRRLLAELARVVRPGGDVLLTCPSARFPITYDPINWALAPTGAHVDLGAFGFGHSWLVREEELLDWDRGAGLEVRGTERLSKALASLLECYWPGLLQRFLKANAANTAQARRILPKLRPSHEEPPLVGLADLIVDLDARVLAKSVRSVGLGVRLRRPRQRISV